MTNDLRKFAAFAVEMKMIRLGFPEHSEEIDKAIYDVGQKLTDCNDPNCNCGFDFKTFHAISNQNAEVEQWD